MWKEATSKSSAAWYTGHGTYKNKVQAHSKMQATPPPRPPQGGGVARGHGAGVFAFGGAYWPLATAHSDPLWVRTCFSLCQRRVCVPGTGPALSP